ncbi:ribbon-helix-helix domain-containing protein [Thermofilum pendens]|uniref:ribbon-helix-helix domain-containing protein n=1 Tax=Thermofilum pendens TaxID=2269 RepID=UPI000325C4AA|nr:ribbon-helix-helix domain-containing protein [Thermofilum pendens]
MVQGRGGTYDLVKVNFRVSIEDYNKMLELVKSGEYSSVSELVRHAVELLVSEYKSLDAMKGSR